MKVDDLLEQYSYVYICRILNPIEGWVEKRMKGEWRGESAEGLPTRGNPKAKL